MFDILDIATEDFFPLINPDIQSLVKDDVIKIWDNFLEDLNPILEHLEKLSFSRGKRIHYPRDQMLQDLLMADHYYEKWKKWLEIESVVNRTILFDGHLSCHLRLYTIFS